jgi:hypothetical protein
MAATTKAAAKKSSTKKVAAGKTAGRTARAAATRSTRSSGTTPTADEPFDPTAPGLHGKLLDDSGKRPPFDGYQVALTIKRTTEMTETTDDGEMSRTTETSTTTELWHAFAEARADGTFTVAASTAADEIVEEHVYAPNGGEVRVVRATTESGERRIRVIPAPQVELPARVASTSRQFLLRAYVVEKTTLQPAPSGLAVSVWKQKAKDTKILEGTATTLKGGMFEMPLTIANGEGLSARLGAAGDIVERIPTPVPEQPSVTAILPIYEAPLTPDSRPEDKDCRCDDTGTTARTPDAVSLATDGTFSADLGGRCVQFTVPNRALEEFDLYSVVRTTDPMVQAITLDDQSEVELLANRDEPTLVNAMTPSVRPVVPARTSAQPPAVALGVRVADALSQAMFSPSPADGIFVGSGRAATTAAAAAAAPTASISEISDSAPLPTVRSLLGPFRRNLDLAKLGIRIPEVDLRPYRKRISESTPIDWDDTPTINQAVTIAHGHLLHWRQTWRSDGYSLGDLLYSLPLAAGQKRRVAVVDWERSDLASRGEETQFNEALQNVSAHQRDLMEVVHGVVTEGISGGSHASSAGIGAGLGAAGSGNVGMYSLGAVFGISGGAGFSDAKAFQNGARTAAAESAQTLRELTMQSASALRGVRSTTVVSVAENETARATTEVVANHNHCHAITVQYFEVLRHLRVDTELVDTQECLFVPLQMTPFDVNKVLRWRPELAVTLKDRTLAGGFEAMQRVATHWHMTRSPIGRYADEQVLGIRGDMRIMLTVPVPPPPPDRTLQKLTVQTATDDAKGAAEVASKTADAGPDWMKAIQTFVTAGGSDAARASAVASADELKNALQRHAAYAIAMIDAQPSERSRYDYFFTYIMPRFAAAFVDQLRVLVVDEDGNRWDIMADFTLVDMYVPGSPLRVTFNAPDITGLTRARIKSLTIRSDLPLPMGARAIAVGINAEYESEAFEHRLLSQPGLVDDIDCGEFAYDGTAVDPAKLAKVFAGPGVSMRCPLDEWEQRVPRFEDLRLSAMVLDHLNDNLEYYHHCIWRAMDPNRRFMLLDGFVGPNGRSLSSSLENRLMAIVGNSLVFPVAPGVQLDPTITTVGTGDGVDLKHYYSQGHPLPYRISFPTRGVFAESVMGSCQACEDIDDSKNWRWDVSPIDDVPTPTADTATRRFEPQGLTPTQPPAPIVSLQAPSTVPDPTGLSSLITLLSNPNFRDAMGLTATQANAAAALQQALSTSSEFGKQAADLAKQASAQRSLDRNMSAIDKAEASQKLPSTDAERLRKTALENAVGAPAAPNPGEVADKLKMIKEAVSDGSVDAGSAKQLAETVLKAAVGDETPNVPPEKAAATKAIESITTEKRVGHVEIGEPIIGKPSIRVDTDTAAGFTLGEVPSAPDPSVPEIVSHILELAHMGGDLVEIAAAYGELTGVVSESTLLLVEATIGPVATVVGSIASVAGVIIGLANALHTGLRHDETMGWVYGIAWAIDDESAIATASTRVPRPTGVDYAPQARFPAADPLDEVRAAFEKGFDRGAELIKKSPMNDEEKDVKARLVVALAVGVSKLGNKAGHIQFITHLYRYTYHDDLGNFGGHKNYVLDWPAIVVTGTAP